MVTVRNKSTFELAKEYYPELWNKDRIAGLVRLNLLTITEYEQITRESYYDGTPIESEDESPATPPENDETQKGPETESEE